MKILVYIGLAAGLLVLGFGACVGLEAIGKGTIEQHPELCDSAFQQHSLSFPVRNSWECAC